MNLDDRPLAPDPYDSLPPVPTFLLESEDLLEGGVMPVAQTLAGGSISPHLRWSGFPGQTRGFVLTCFDPDAPTPSGWWHWVVVDLTPDVTELARGAGTSDLELDGAAFHLRADHGEASYDGAAPPAGDTDRHPLNAGPLSGSHRPGRPPRRGETSNPNEMRDARHHLCHNLITVSSQIEIVDGVPWDEAASVLPGAGAVLAVHDDVPRTEGAS